MGTPTSFTCLLLTSSLLLASWFSAIDAQSRPPIVDGLSWTFYQSSCPKHESIIRNELKKVFKKDIGQAAGLLRLHSHDSFVLRSEIPNLSLRKESFQIVNDLRERVHKQCDRVTGGPDYEVTLGRQDGVKLAKVNKTFEDLVATFATTSTVLAKFARKGLDAIDTVALSDPNMEKTFANNLKQTCPAPDSKGITVLDIRTPDKFDDKYFIDLMNHQGLSTSDQDLFTDTRTRDIVTSFAVDEALFFEKFVLSMIKMGQVDVLTGRQGEISANCAVRNSDNKYLASVVEEGLGSSSEMK
ncbi:hypothetical protein P3X46_021553 [Hevea brasiliensis]|uniref:peroxidase n=1 Tax=Hevea brasiliensis TaxID=3981 RepID=A0ABQ9LHX9_HEVBR|nr:hypothetical protein P3X46_021553 [Hevea brasiliensis]